MNENEIQDAVNLALKPDSEPAVYNLMGDYSVRLNRVVSTDPEDHTIRCRATINLFENLFVAHHVFALAEDGVKFLADFQGGEYFPAAQ